MADISKILIIEDNDTDYMIFERHLELVSDARQYQLYHENNYEDGLKALLQDRYDLCFVDYSLHSKNGLDLIVQALEKGVEGPFIILTSADEEKLFKDFLTLDGVYDYILKQELSTSLLHRVLMYAQKRLQVENELKVEKAFSSDVVAESPYMIIGVGEKGDVVSVNPATLKITGFKEKELIGMHWKSLFADEQQVQFVIHDDEYTGFQADTLCKDGKTRVVYWNVLGKSGNPDKTPKARFALTGKDVTADLENEAKRLQSEKMQALGHLAGGMAHEINNLLQPILFGSDILQKNLEHDEKALKTCQKIMRNAQSASKIVADVLVFSRKPDAVQEPQRLKPVLDDALQLVLDQKHDGAELKISGRNEIENIKARVESIDVERVFLNVILNAFQAMDNSGIVNILFERLPTGKTIGLQSIPYLSVKIKDHGPGIDPDYIGCIFNPFFTTKESGTGLGLPIVYNIVQGWGGNINVYNNQEGSGATFEFYIPLVNT